MDRKRDGGWMNGEQNRIDGQKHISKRRQVDWYIGRNKQPTSRIETYRFFYPQIFTSPSCLLIFTFNFWLFSSNLFPQIFTSSYFHILISSHVGPFHHVSVTLWANRRLVFFQLFFQTCRFLQRHTLRASSHNFASRKCVCDKFSARQFIQLVDNFSGFLSLEKNFIIFIFFMGLLLHASMNCVTIWRKKSLSNALIFFWKVKF